MDCIFRDMVDRAYNITLVRKEPFHYKRMYDELTNGEKRHNISKCTDDAENFRNRLDYLEYRRFKSLKKGTGWFTISHWVKPHTIIQCFPKASHQLSLDTRSKAMIDAGNRVRYMVNKHNDDAKTRCDKVLKGKTNEMGTIEYFKKRYNEYINTPNNAYNQHDEWDFIFKTNDKIVRFDAKTIGVFNETEKAVYIEKYRIARNWADVFVCVKSNGDLTIHGYILKDEMEKAIETNNYYIFKENIWHDPYYLEVYLNHLIKGFDEPVILQNGHQWNQWRRGGEIKWK